MNNVLLILLFSIGFVYILDLLLWLTWNRWYYQSGIMIYRKCLAKNSDIDTFISRINLTKAQIKFKKHKKMLLVHPRPPFTELGHTRWVVKFSKNDIKIECRISNFFIVLYSAILIYAFSFAIDRNLNAPLDLLIVCCITLALSVGFIAFILYERSIVLNGLSDLIKNTLRNKTR